MNVRLFILSYIKVLERLKKWKLVQCIAYMMDTDNIIKGFEAMGPFIMSMGGNVDNPNRYQGKKK